MDSALHVQHKDQEIFERENRVIPSNVVAVCMDTGDVRFGDGVNPWRFLTQYTVGDGTPATEPKSGFSGPLHVSVVSAEEADLDDEGTPKYMPHVPGRNEMVILPFDNGFVFGNGVDAISDLPRVVTGDLSVMQEGGF